MDNKYGVSDEVALAIARDVANACYDGHVNVLKFTTNWRVKFGGFIAEDFEHSAVSRMGCGPSLIEAVIAAVRIEVRGLRGKSTD